MTFSKLSKEQHWTQHRVLRNFILDGLKSTNRHVYVENTIDTLQHSWQAETTIYCTSILAGLKFNKGFCLKLLVSFLSYLNLCFALTENKVAVTELECVEERISLASEKENTYWIIQAYYVQSSSGVVVKLGLLSERHSLLYDKLYIKQKSNKQRKLPTSPSRPVTRPLIVTTQPSLP